MNITVFRHTLNNSLGSLAQVLEARGSNYNYVDVATTDIAAFDPKAPDILIIMGGSPGVYQALDYPFLSDEMRVLEKRLAEDLPTLGICLGGQLMAQTLGGEVRLGEKGVERGWLELNVNDEGQNSAVRHLDCSKTKMLQWHQDTFSLPEGATLLASSSMYDNQIFSYGRNALAIQSHPEVTKDVLATWSVSAAGLVYNKDLDLKIFRQETDQNVDRLVSQTALFFNEWLDYVEG